MRWDSVAIVWTEGEIRNTQRQKTLRVGLECSSWVARNGGDMQATTTAATHACAYIA